MTASLVAHVADLGMHLATVLREPVGGACIFHRIGGPDRDIRAGRGQPFGNPRPMPPLPSVTSAALPLRSNECVVIWLSPRAVGHSSLGTGFKASEWKKLAVAGQPKYAGQHNPHHPM